MHGTQPHHQRWIAGSGSDDETRVQGRGIGPCGAVAGSVPLVLDIVICRAVCRPWLHVGVTQCNTHQHKNTRLFGLSQRTMLHVPNDRTMVLHTSTSNDSSRVCKTCMCVCLDARTRCNIRQTLAHNRARLHSVHWTSLPADLQQCSCPSRRTCS